MISFVLSLTAGTFDGASPLATTANEKQVASQQNNGQSYNVALPDPGNIGQLWPRRDTQDISEAIGTRPDVPVDISVGDIASPGPPANTAQRDDFLVSQINARAAGATFVRVAVVNLNTGAEVQRITLVNQNPADLERWGTDQCVIVPSGFALSILDDGPAGLRVFSCAYTAIDRPEAVAQLCCCNGNGNGEVCCPPEISPSTWAQFPGQPPWTFNGTAFFGITSPLPAAATIKVAIEKADPAATVTIGEDASSKSPVGGTQPTATFTLLAPPPPGECQLGDVMIDFTGVPESGQRYAVTIRNPCGCCTSFGIELPTAV